MTHKLISTICATFLLLGLAATTEAAEWNKQQLAVWNVVAQSWADDVAGNGKWPAQYVHEDAVSWGASWPQPRGKASIEKWSRFGSENNKVLQYELFPEAIVVAGDTAVVHYSIVGVNENYEKKRKRDQAGNIETLVRSGKSWKFVSLTGFEIGGK